MLFKYSHFRDSKNRLLYLRVNLNKIVFNIVINDKLVILNKIPRFYNGILLFSSL